MLASFDPAWTGGGSYGSALAGRFTGDLIGLAIGTAGGVIAHRVLNGGNSNPFAGVLGGKGTNQVDDVLPDTVYRGDTRGPDKIFEEGFVPRSPGSNVSLEDYVDLNTPSSFVSTTKNPPSGTAVEGSPEYFGTAYGEIPGYVYTIDNPGGGIDVNKVYPGAAFPNENEIAFPGGINTNCIIGCIPVAPNGVSTGPLIPNPNYTGGIQ